MGELTFQNHMSNTLYEIRLYELRATPAQNLRMDCRLSIRESSLTSHGHHGVLSSRDAPHLEEHLRPLVAQNLPTDC